MIQESHEHRTRELAQLIPSVLSVVPPEQSGVTLEDLMQLKSGIDSIHSQFQDALKPFGGDPAIPDPQNTPVSLPQTDFQVAQHLPFLIAEIYLDVQRAREVVAQRALEAMQNNDIPNLAHYVGQFNALEETMHTARSTFNSPAAQKSLRLVEPHLPVDRLSEQLTELHTRKVEEGPSATDLLNQIMNALEQKLSSPTDENPRMHSALEWLNDLEGLERQYSLEAMAINEIAPYKIAGRMLKEARERTRNLAGNIPNQSELANPNDSNDPFPSFSVSYVSAVERGNIIPSLDSLTVLLYRLNIPFDSAFAQVLLKKVFEGAYYMALHPEKKQTDKLSPDQVLEAAQEVLQALGLRKDTINDDLEHFRQELRDPQRVQQSESLHVLRAGFGSRLRAYRNALPGTPSQSMLANQLGISTSWLSQIERGASPSRDVFEQIIKVVGFEPAEANDLREAFGFPRNFTSTRE